MSGINTESKDSLRRRIHELIRALPPEERGDLSQELRIRLMRETVWRRARGVLLFSPLLDEPDTTLLIAEALAAGKDVCLPRFDREGQCYVAARITSPERDLCPGRFGIPEPLPELPAVRLNQLDLVLVPGVAFDPLGFRLGRGKGHYDRMLAEVAVARCGVAYDLQIVDQVPREPHDLKMDFVVTPSRWIGGHG